jgi:protein gp37
MGEKKMQKTLIEYADYTWNPIKMRCTPVSAGCANCWHLRFAKRHMVNPTFGERSRAAYAGGTPRLDLKELEAPSRLKNPARIATQFMGDLFHESISNETIDLVFGSMSKCWRGHGDHYTR